MRGPRAAALQVSPAQLDLLQRLQRQQTADQRRVRRASIILALAANSCVDAVARQLGLTARHGPALAGSWLAATADFQRVEAEPKSQALAKLVEAFLDDAPRPGGPATFGPEQIVQIVAVACEPPEKSGRPISHWTHRELARSRSDRIDQGHRPTKCGAVLKN